MRSRRSNRDVNAGRLGTAASQLYRDLSSSEALSSHSGAAGLLSGLDTFPSFHEPRVARMPPSKRRALLQCAEQGINGAGSAEKAMDGILGVDSSAMYASRLRREGSSVPILSGEFASYHNLLLDFSEYEPTMVSRLEASTVLLPELGPEKAIDGLPDTRWAACDAAGSSITIHLTGTCVVNAFRFKQPTRASGGHVGEWASVISLFFSDDSEQEFVVNATEEGGEVQQVFEFPPIAADWVRVMIKASHGNRGAGLSDVQLFGYSAACTNLLVRQGEKVQLALLAAQVGLVNTTIWIAAGSYFESLEVMCPVTIMALSAKPSIICSLDQKRPALTCAVPGVYVHGLVLVQAGAVLSKAADSFTYDRLAPGLLGAHWTHPQIHTDNFGDYEGHGSLPRDQGSEMGVWDRVKTTISQDADADERHRRVAAEFPSVLADVVRYEEILAAFEEKGAAHIRELKDHSSELKAHKRELKKAAGESEARVDGDRRLHKELLRQQGHKDRLAQVAMQVEMLREETRVADSKQNTLRDVALKAEALLKLLVARLSEESSKGEALVLEVKNSGDFFSQTPKVRLAQEELQAWKEAQETINNEYTEAKEQDRSVRVTWEASAEEAQHVTDDFKKNKAQEAGVIALLMLENILQVVHEHVEVAPELLEINILIEETRQERKGIKAEMAAILAETAEATENVQHRVNAVEKMRQELEPAAVYAVYGAEIVLTRCRVRSAVGSGIVAGPRALVVARNSTVSDCGRHGVFCHNGGRILLDEVSILRCRQYGALALHANFPPKNLEGTADKDDAAPDSPLHADSAKPMTPKTPNFSRATTPHNGAVAPSSSRPWSRFSNAGVEDGQVDDAAHFEKQSPSTIYFGPPAIVARNSTMAYNGVAGVGGDLGAEIELDHCGVLSNRREGLVASGDSTYVSLHDCISASNGAQGVHVNTHALVVAKNASILGNGQQGCLVVGHHSSLKLHAGVVRLNGMQGLEMRDGGFVSLRAHALVDLNYAAVPLAVQARVDGTGSWLDVEDSSVGSATNAFSASISCENGGRAHVHWTAQLETAQDLQPSYDGYGADDYKQYRKEARTLDIDEQQTIVSGQVRVRIKCHPGTELSSPVVREYEWLTSAAACNHFELAQHVMQCVREEDARQELLPQRLRKPAMKLPDGFANAWRVFYSERATADESIQHEGDLVGPIADRPIWDFLPKAVSLHLYPNDKAGPEAKRQKDVAARLIQQQLEEVARARALERQNKLARMYPESREQCIRLYSQQQQQHVRHVAHMRRVRAAKEEGLVDDRVVTPAPDPEKNRIVKGKGREKYAFFQGVGSGDSDWVAMKEERSGDTYWCVRVCVSCVYICTCVWVYTYGGALWRYSLVCVYMDMMCIFMYMCVCVYIYICVCVCVCVCVWRIALAILTGVFVCVHDVYIHVRLCEYIYIYICLCVCVYVCVYVWKSTLAIRTGVCVYVYEMYFCI